MGGRPVQSLLLAMLLFVILSPQLACTAIGALVGDRVDSGLASRRVLAPGDAIAAKPGTRMTLMLRDGRRVTGTYRDTTNLGPAAYAEVWRRWQAVPGKVGIITTGDRVTVK